MASARSLYDILNVSPAAEPVVLDAAYKALMKKYHPDQAEDPARARDAAEINEAFATLKDPARRAEYDKKLWSKQQAILRAELRALEPVPPSRGSRLFGWGGWILAAGIGCAFAAMAVERRIADKVPVAAIEAAEKAAPTPAAIESLGKRAAAEIDDVAPPPSSDAILARLRSKLGAPQRPAETSRPVQLRSAAALRQAPARRSGAGAARPAAAKRQAAGRKEKADFLEREGYIY